MTLEVVGVRHHSPACARVVAAVLERVQPAVVLVEGPADYNPWMAELALAHQPPVAIFTHHTTEHGPFACFTPFLPWSPEWVAIRWGLARGAIVRFIDLPAWDKAFAGVANRYRDGFERYERILDVLGERTGMGDPDALWDHLFEQQTNPDALEVSLAAYFEELRADAEPGPRDGPREDYMRAWVGWGLGRGDTVAVVGGWHTNALRQVDPHDVEPTVTAPEFGGESHLVPWSYARSDSFAGYQAGMPSPGWWEAVVRDGNERAADAVVAEALAALRKSSQPPTTADHVALRTTLRTLASLRGHAVPTRTDVLDAFVTVLVREALPAELPWTRRGSATPGAHPTVTTLLRTFQGDRFGQLAPDAARPALLHDVEAELSRHELGPGTRAFDWAEPDDRPPLRVLHRLRLLGIPGFRRTRGPTLGTDVRMRESWTVWRTVDTEPALIEASRWGSTLLGAAAHRLEWRLVEAQRLAAVVEVLGDAAFVGVTELAGTAAERVAHRVATITDLAELGPAIALLLGLWRHGEWLEVVGAPLLTPILRDAGERALTLLATLQGEELAPNQLQAMVDLRGLLRQAVPLGLDPEAIRSVLDRRRGDRTAPAMLRGAALGLLWSLDPERASLDDAIDAARIASSEERLGDFLAGVFALARAPTLRDGRLLAAVDQVVSALDPEVFLAALPSLRLAFSWFPAQERRQIARLLAESWGEAPRTDWLGEVPVDVLARGLRLDDDVDAWARRLGLLS